MNVPALIQFPETEDRSNTSDLSAPQARSTDRTRPNALSAVLLDLVLSVFGGVLALRVEFSFGFFTWHWLSPQHPNLDLLGINVGFLFLYVALLLFAAHSQNLYRPSAVRPSLRDGLIVIRAAAIATLVLTAFIYVSGIHTISRLVVGLAVVFSIVGLTSWRACRWHFRKRQLARGIGFRHVLIVGAGRVGQILANHLDENPSLGYKFKGFVDPNHHKDPRMLGKVDDICQIVRQEFIDEIFVTLPSDREMIKSVALEMGQFNVSLKVIPELYDGFASLAPEEFIGNFPVQVLQRGYIPDVHLYLKRLVDIVGSAVGIVVLSPFLALISLLVKLDSVGPVFYRASRVGKKGRRFVCYKFRTMVARADEQKSGLRHLNERVGPLFKISNDPRVTRLGVFLRKYSLDELPQLWNVLRGDMSLVGPRPPEFDEIGAYRLEHLSRLDATPGITGLWQVNARHDPSFDTAVALDNFYIQNWNLLLDFKILFKTIPVVLKGLGR